MIIISNTILTHRLSEFPIAFTAQGDFAAFAMHGLMEYVSTSKTLELIGYIRSIWVSIVVLFPVLRRTTRYAVRDIAHSTT